MKSLLILAMLASPALADDVHEIAYGATTRGLRSNSANALTDQSLGGGAVTYGYRLPVDTLPRLGVWAEAGLDWGAADGTMFQTLDTSIDTFGLSLGGRARYRLLPHVLATARVAFGSVREAIGVNDRMGHSASSHGWGATTTASAGLDLLAVDQARWGLGLRFELGYTAATKVAMTTTPDRPDDGTIKLPMTDASFGKLDLSGPFLGFQILGRF